MPSSLDLRTEFRATFCAVLQRSAVNGTPPCDAFLWRLTDEPQPGAVAAQPEVAAPPRHRVFVVTGAFGDCRLPGLVPFADALPRLASDGVSVQVVQVGGRSGATHNAREIADTLRRAGLRPDERIVLVGYSKGAVDILQFLVDEPDLARHVAAVVSVAGPILGSPLASKSAPLYDSVLKGAFAEVCDPGDGRMVDSLRPEVRRGFLRDHTLPADVRYFSLAAFPTAEHLAAGLHEPWRLLASSSLFNDGQVVAEDAVIPGSAVLGYVNADHWDIALAVEQGLPRIAARSSPRAFPRGALLEALLLFVEEQLAAAPPDRSGST